jgi:hypothetical protein
MVACSVTAAAVCRRSAVTSPPRRHSSPSRSATSTSTLPKCRPSKESAIFSRRRTGRAPCRASCQVSQNACFGCWAIPEPTRLLGGQTKSTPQHLVRSRMCPPQSLPSLWSPKWLSINSHSRISSRSNKLNRPATSLKRPKPGTLRPRRRTAKCPLRMAKGQSTATNAA